MAVKSLSAQTKEVSWQVLTPYTSLMRAPHFLLLFLVLALGCGATIERSANQQQVRTLALVPYLYGDHPAVLVAAGALEQEFGLRVTILESRELPAEAKQLQEGGWNAAFFLKDLEKGTEAYDKVLGLTEAHIFLPDALESEPESAGASRVNGRTALVSIYSMYDWPVIRPKGVADVAIHEVGHCLGLGHCPDENCVMFRKAARQKELGVDVQRTFCSGCKIQLPPL